MVSIRTRLDDVLLHIRGTKAEATDTVRVSVPAIGTEDGVAVRFAVDVSPEGKKVLEGMIEKASKATVAAWAPVLDLDETRREAVKHARALKKTAKAKAAEPVDAPDPGNPAEEG